MITIFDRIQDPADFSFWSADATFPQFKDPPTLLKQQGSVPEVSFNVLVKLNSPELFASSRGSGIPAAKVSVPEATMYKNAEIVAGEHDIWTTGKLLRMQSIPKPMTMQQFPDLQFGRCIAAADSCHHPRPDLFTDYVHD